MSESKNEPNPSANSHITELAAKVKTEPNLFSDFEKRFILENAARVETFGEGTNFSIRQAELADKIHAEKIRGEKPAPVEKLPNAVASEQLKKLAPMVAVDVDGKFSDFEKELILNAHEFSKKLGDEMTFSVKQADVIDKIYRQKVLGEKVEKSKSKPSK